MPEKLKWGILSTGRIAGEFARGVIDSESGEMAAVGSRSLEKAERFGEEFCVPNRHGSYEELVADPAVEAVYISTPHPMHAEWAIRAAEAGKHVLCEKPLTVHYDDAVQVVEAAKRNDVFLMEAFMYRCYPQTRRIVELIRDGAIGEVKVINASFGFSGDFDLSHRILNKDLGGGGILDVGCYAVSMSRLVAGAAQGKDFADPISLEAKGHIGEESGVDEYATATLAFPGEIIAQVSTGVKLELENKVRIFGTKGRLTIPEPWFGGLKKGSSDLILHRNGEEEPESIRIESHPNIFTIEADVVARRIPDRQAPPPCMTWDDTLGNMKTLEWWLEEIGLSYP